MNTATEHQKLICTSGKKIEQLTLKTSEDAFLHLRDMMQSGFFVVVPAGLTARALLAQVFGIENDYIDGRIKAIFINNSPVDDIDTAVVPDECRLTMSAALPGVAGITMQRQNMIAAYRADITYEAGDDSCTADAIMVRVKLLNFIGPETAPNFFSYGVCLDSADWERFAGKLEASFAPTVKAASFEGKAIAASEIKNIPAPGAETLRFISVEIEA